MAKYIFNRTQRIYILRGKTIVW